MPDRARATSPDGGAGEFFQRFLHVASSSAVVKEAAMKLGEVRAVLSADAVTIRTPSQLNAADSTACSCPRSTAISFPVAASQMRAVSSS